MLRIVVHGDRVCRVCKGLVVDGYRFRRGPRRSYFDGIACLNRYIQQHPRREFDATEAVTVIACSKVNS